MDANRDVRINEDFSWNFLAGGYMPQRKSCHPTKCIIRTKRTILPTPAPRNSKVHIFVTPKKTVLETETSCRKRRPLQLLLSQMKAKVRMNNLNKPVKLWGLQRIEYTWLAKVMVFWISWIKSWKMKVSVLKKKLKGDAVKNEKGTAK